MADPTKHFNVNNLRSLFQTRRTKIFAYGFMVSFVACTVFLAFSPSTNSSSPWFTNIFSADSGSYYRSHFSSLFSHLFPNSTQPTSHSAVNSTRSHAPDAGFEGLAGNRTAETKVGSNRTVTGTLSSSKRMEGEKERKKRREGLIKGLMGCDVFDGRWVRVEDDSYPLYPPGSCPHIDEPFNCYRNGRPDSEYEKLRWQPHGCQIPRLDGKEMLELIRGKRLVFVGDSLNRNMWESLVCILRNSVEDKSKVFEASGRQEFRTEGSYSFVFKDYNCSVEFFRSPFLVQEWEMPENGSKHETLRLDLVERSSSRYKNADIIIFNTGHWWTHEKTSKGKDYYQEGSHIYGELNVVEAFRKALTTWARWVDANINHEKTLVFFRGYSSSHFRGGRWNSGGQCDSETQPIKNETYLAKYPPKMRVLENVLHGMKTSIIYLNITRMTDYRKDAHPSIYRKQNLTGEERRSPMRYQDCSHWCLPGVPDTWNELVYAELLIRLNQNKHQPQQPPQQAQQHQQQPQNQQQPKQQPQQDQQQKQQMQPGQQDQQQKQP
ncbi:hypothetical protein Sjap_002452 [Stephania japonica]|uniref:Trichome birefringence-like N-terminal domain-containing protein n=1 Tax=Stephania japonica TaxID=461633 RepID=A0AAP0PSN1_9MAGN